MTKVRYFWLISTSVVVALALFWRERKPAPVKIVTNEKQMAQYYVQMTKRLFDIQLNGALRLYYHLNDDPELRAIGFQCVLIHVIETTPKGTARSQWDLPFTESFLVPYNAGDLRWRQPSGRTLLFKNGQTTKDSVVQGGDGWELRKLGPSIYNIHNILGEAFYYENGCLSEITTRSGSHYRVVTRGGLITRVTEVSQYKPERLLFAAEFDDLGHCLRVEFASHPAEEFEWDAKGFLADWKEGSGRHVSFRYNDGLLNHVIGPEKADLPIIWSENKDFVNHSVTYGMPVWVSSVGVRNYDLSYSAQGVGIAITGPDKIQNSTTIYNPLTRTLVQESAGQILSFHFNSVEGEAPFRIQTVELTHSGK